MAEQSILSKIAGFCVACGFVGGGILKCVQDNNKSTHYVPSPTTSTVIEPKPEPDPDPYPQYEEYWYDDPWCNGTGDCNVCDGVGGYDISGSHYMCNACNGTGRCSNCGGQGQCKGIRTVTE